MKNTGNEIKANMDNTRNEMKTNMDNTGNEIEANKDNIGNEIDANMDNTWNEIEANMGNITGTEIEANMDNTGNEIDANMGNTGNEIETNKDNTWTEIEANMDNTWTEIEANMDNTGNEIEANKDNAGTEIEANMDNSGTEIEANIDNAGNEIETVTYLPLDQLEQYIYPDNNITHAPEVEPNDMPVEFEEVFLCEEEVVEEVEEIIASRGVIYESAALAENPNSYDDPSDSWHGNQSVDVDTSTVDATAAATVPTVRSCVKLSKWPDEDSHSNAEYDISRLLKSLKKMTSSKLWFYSSEVYKL